MSGNPFAPPPIVTSSSSASSADVLAGRWTRLGSALIDGLIMAIIVMPAMFATGYYERVQTQRASFSEQIAMALFGMAVMLILNGFLLFTRGQTIGKLITGIQIVDARSGRLLSFPRVYVMRYLWMLPLNLVVAFLPGTTDDMLVSIVGILDAVLIFSADRRCLHDHIAGSKVVVYRAGRQKGS